MALILITEDDPDTLELLVRLVEGLGHQVIAASSGEEAIEQCSPGLDLAILDYMLPGVNGATVAMELKTLGVPFLFISATNDDSAIASIVDLAPLGYIEKPFGINGVRASIQSALMRAANDPRNTLTRLINQAVGMLMYKHSVDNTSAYFMLRNAARRAGMSVFQLAERMAMAHDIIYKVSR